MEILGFSDKIRPMKVKQIIITVKASEGAQRVVYNSEGKVLSGDEKRAIKLGSTENHRRAITVRGTKGESIHATINVHGENRTTSSGNLDAVNAVLRDTWPGLVESYLLRTNVDLSRPGDAQEPHHQHEPSASANAAEQSTPASDDGSADDTAATLSA